MVAFGLQVAEIIGFHCSLQHILLSHNIFLKFQHAIMKREKKNHSVQKKVNFLLKAIRKKLPPKNKKPLKRSQHKDMGEYLILK